MKNKMIKYALLLAVAFVFESTQLDAQMIQLKGHDSAHATKFEIGAIVLQNSIHNKFVYGADADYVRNNKFFSGLALRLHSKKVTWRLSLGGYQESYDFEPAFSNQNNGGLLFESSQITNDPVFLNSVLRNTAEVKIGGQLSIFEARFSAYVFGDLGYRFVQESRFYTYTTTFQKVETVHNVLEKANSNFFAIHSGLGLRYQFSSNFYAAYECSAIGGVESRTSDRKERLQDSRPMINYMPASVMFGIYF